MNKAFSTRFSRTLCVFIAVLAAACGSEPPSTPADAAASASASHMPIGQLPAIDAGQLLTHTKVLSSDEYEGRAPGTKGEQLTVAYISDQFKKTGAEPGNTDGTYIQKVPLVGITPTPAPLVIRKGTAKHTLKWKDDVVAWTKHVAEKASIDDSELVFVGYGVVAPEFNWDDYKDVDVKGKTIIMLVNDPPVPDPNNPAELDPKMFGGKAMTYYGRWTYKFEIASQKGAAAALIVHETGPAGYPFGALASWRQENFDIRTPDKNMNRVAVESWITDTKAKELFAAAGQDFDALKKAALSKDFKPVAFKAKANISIKSALREVDSQNVVAKLEGSDPKLKDEYVVYSAHWDHMGRDPKLAGDQIFNGALDNASGTAALLELAEAYTRLATPPKRSILFLAVT